MTQLEDIELSSDIWFLESGCSNHMTTIRSLFKDFDESHKMKVRLGNDNKSRLKGKVQWQSIMVMVK